ncbi:hypothetical protein NKI38_10255 [Mesorhizobium sp. M0621]
MTQWIEPIGYAASLAVFASLPINIVRLIQLRRPGLWRKTTAIFRETRQR